MDRDAVSQEKTDGRVPGGIAFKRHPSQQFTSPESILTQCDSHSRHMQLIFNYFERDI